MHTYQHGSSSIVRCTHASHLISHLEVPPVRYCRCKHLLPSFKFRLTVPLLSLSSRISDHSQVQQVHLSLTSEANSMRVSWVTGNASQTPAVRFREVALPVPSGVDGTGELVGGQVQVASWRVRTSLFPCPIGLAGEASPLRIRRFFLLG